MIQRLARAAIASTTTIAVTLLFSADSHASGLYFSDRGVRPLGRGGAFVAGADDIGSTWYNPAGLADAGTSLLADFSWLNFSAEFTRQTNVTDSSGAIHTYTFPTVNGSSPVIPIPTLGASYNFGKNKEFTAAFSIIAPYTAITSFPQTQNGQPAPSRYSLISLDGSLLVVPGVYFAWKPIEQIRLGAGLQMLTGTFKSTIDFSASVPDRVLTAPEDPNYDAYSQLSVGPIFAPSANGGVTIVPDKHVRIGVSGQLPFVIDAPGTTNVRLPTAAVFDNAQQVGDNVHVRFELPAVFRAGVEVRPTDALRLEATFVREFWTTHHAIDINIDNVTLTGVTGFPSPFKVANISIPRNFDNANSYRLGGEYTIPIQKTDYAIDIRAGFNYDQSAVPTAYLSPLTIDLNKYTVSLGGGLHIGTHWRLDAVYAHIFTADQYVDPAIAASPQINPVKGNPTATGSVNGGTYSARADVIGVGVNYKF
ncbi:MAG: outer membrane protein transport protein [Polyangiaceae bacterium]